MGGPEQPWGWGQGSRVPGARGRSSELSRGRREPSPQCRFASAGSRLRDTCEGVVWTSPGGTLPGRVFPPQAVCASPAGSRRSSVRGGVGSPDLGARAQTHAHTNHLCMHTQLTRLCMAARAHSRTLTHTHTCSHTQAPPHACTCTHTHTPRQTHGFTYRLVHTQAHTDQGTLHVSTHTDPLTYTHTHTHTCSHMLAHTCSRTALRTGSHPPRGAPPAAHAPASPTAPSGSSGLSPVPLLREIL